MKYQGLEDLIIGKFTFDENKKFMKVREVIITKTEDFAKMILKGEDFSKKNTKSREIIINLTNFQFENLILFNTEEDLIKLLID